MSCFVSPITDTWIWFKDSLSLPCRLNFVPLLQGWSKSWSNVAIYLKVIFIQRSEPLTQTLSSLLQPGYEIHITWQFLCCCFSSSLLGVASEQIIFTSGGTAPPFAWLVWHFCYCSHPALCILIEWHLCFCLLLEQPPEICSYKDSWSSFHWWWLSGSATSCPCTGRIHSTRNIRSLCNIPSIRGSACLHCTTLHSSFLLILHQLVNLLSFLPLLFFLSL